MKTKLIGFFLLLIGMLSFWDDMTPGGLRIGLIHLEEFFFPMTCVFIGWLELHGRETSMKSKKHAHIFTIIIIVIIGFLFWKALHPHAL